jgi:hypothetical protein
MALIAPALTGTMVSLFLCLSEICFYLLSLIALTLVYIGLKCVCGFFFLAVAVIFWWRFFVVVFFLTVV